MWPKQSLYASLWSLPVMFPRTCSQRRVARSNQIIMVTTDPISDMLARIHNGYMAGKKAVVLPWSKVKESLANVLAQNRYLSKVETTTDDGKKNLQLELKYNGKIAAMQSVKRISKPSVRVYANKHQLPKVLGGMGIAIISTPQGLLTDKEARKKGLGGEVICEVS